MKAFFLALSTVGLVVFPSTNVSANGSRTDSRYAMQAITDCGSLQNISLSGSYQLGSDIDCTNVNFVPIGTNDAPFIGTLDGNGFGIKNLTVTNTKECASGTDCAGLFAVAGGGSNLINLRLSNISINVTCSRSCFVGGIAGAASKIDSSYVQGTILVQGTQAAASPYIGGAAGVADNLSRLQSDVTIVVSGYFCTNYIGGLVGENAYDGIVKHASALGTISVSNSKGCSIENPVGGLAGVNYGAISDSGASVDITESMSPDSAALDGGFVGEQEGTIARSFATGSLNSTAVNSAVGGFVGSGWQIQEAFATGTVTSSGIATGGFGGQDTGTSQAYSTVLVKSSGEYLGGFDGFGPGALTSSHWDLNSSGITNPSKACGNVANCSGVIGLPTKLLQASLPSGFSVGDWAIIPGISYPYLMPSFTQLSSEYYLSTIGNAYKSRAATCLASVYAMIALAAGDLQSTIDEFWTNAGAVWHDIAGVTHVGQLMLDDSNVLSALNAGKLVAIKLYAAGEGQHFILALQTARPRQIIANDSWTGTRLQINFDHFNPKVEFGVVEDVLDPVTGQWVYVIDPSTLRPYLDKPDAPQSIKDLIAHLPAGFSVPSTYDAVPSYQFRFGEATFALSNLPHRGYSHRSR